MSRLSDLRQMAVNQMATRLASELDAIIRQCLERTLGESFSLESLRGRLACHIDQTTRVETYVFDSTALVSFWPMEFHYEGLTIRVTRTYKVH